MATPARQPTDPSAGKTQVPQIPATTPPDQAGAQPAMTPSELNEATGEQQTVTSAEPLQEQPALTSNGSTGVSKDDSKAQTKQELVAPSLPFGITQRKVGNLLKYIWFNKRVCQLAERERVYMVFYLAPAVGTPRRRKAAYQQDVQGES